MRYLINEKKQYIIRKGANKKKKKLGGEKTRKEIQKENFREKILGRKFQEESFRKKILGKKFPGRELQRG